MNCNDCMENLVAYLEGLLDPEQVQRLGEHLKLCGGCRAECAEFAHLRERLIGCARASVRLGNRKGL